MNPDFLSPRMIWFVNDVAQDIVGMLDSAGNLVVEYEYDAYTQTAKESVMRRKESEQPYGLDLLDERATAFHDCICFMRQAYPNFGITTYDRRVHRGSEHIVLAKFVTGTGDDSPVWSVYENTSEVTSADNIPGGLFSHTVLSDEREYDVELCPMIIGRDEAAFENQSQKHLGGAVIRIVNRTGSALWLKFGGEGLAFMHYSPNKAFRGEDIASVPGCAAEIIDDFTVLLRRQCGDGEGISTAVKGPFDIVRVENSKNGAEGASYAVCRMSGEEIYLTAAFTESDVEALAMAAKDPWEELQKVREHYRKLAGSAELTTPEASLNEAFTHALYNVEYAWLRPYGWIESIQHWPTMWHMEHTAHEEWLGNFDRVRDCLRSQMKNVFDSGAIPDMCPTGGGRRDWGGNNQFFLREVRHYVEMSGDVEFAREAEPYMENAMRQSMREYDPTGTGVFSWYRQIGNQEDMESTPGMGAATGAEGIQMFRTMAWVKRLLGKEKEAAEYEKLADKAFGTWREHIWDRGLGREIWYEDITGARHLDTTYHGICYPVLYGLVDDIDALSSLDHLKSRLTGPEGEVYQSNHFGDHCINGVPTWGMQAGSDMQPFATMAYCRMGKAEDAVKPLKFVADRVCGGYQRGSWPETANEKRFAYFSPSAAMYTQGVAEGLFGLKRDRTQDMTVIAPCVPESWPEARIKLSGIDTEIKRSHGERCSQTVTASVADNTQKRVIFTIPDSRDLRVTSGGVEIQDFGLRARAGFMQVVVNCGRSRHFSVCAEYEPVAAGFDYDRVAVQGGTVRIQSGGAEICGIIDREGIFEEITLTAQSAECKLKADLLAPYMKFGPLGLMNFARRTFFVKYKPTDMDECPIGPETFLREIHITVLPEKEWTPSAADTAPESFRAKELKLPEALIKPKAYWQELGNAYARGCIVMDPGCFMEGFENGPIELKLKEGVPLCTDPRGFVPFGKEKHPVAAIDLSGHRMRRIWLAISAFIENHDMFTDILRVEAEAVKGESLLRPVFWRDLSFPGDLDMGFGNKVIAGFSSHSEAVNRERTLKYPDIAAGEYDYPEAMPPEFPQPDFWCRNRAFEAGNTVFNLIELDLGEAREMKELRLIPLTADACGGLFAMAYD